MSWSLVAPDSIMARFLISELHRKVAACQKWSEKPWCGEVEMQSLLSAEGGVALPAAEQAHICHTAGRPLSRKSSKSVHNKKNLSWKGLGKERGSQAQRSILGSVPKWFTAENWRPRRSLAKLAFPQRNTSPRLWLPAGFRRYFQRSQLHALFP